MKNYDLQLENGEKIQIELLTKELSNKIVGELVAERKSQKLTQQNIADATGMKTANVTRFEGCKFTPSLEGLIRYAKALGKELRIELVDEQK